MNFKKIVFSVNQGVAYIKLNSPKNLNALTEEMLDDLLVALDKCADDDAIKVVVIVGQGKAFSAGGDIGMMLNGLEEGDQKLGAGVRKAAVVALKIRNLRKVVIASVHGAVAGAGFNLALLCDFRIAAENAKFIQAFVNIGLVPDMGGAFLLTKMLGVARATELIMTGKPVDAQQAFDFGLVNKVVALDDLDQATEKFALKMAQLPTVALGKMKALVNRSAFVGFENVLDNEVEYQIQCTMTEDFKEGIRAFSEKRRPAFKGK